MKLKLHSLFSKKASVTPNAEYENICLYCEYAAKKQTEHGDILICRRRRTRVKESGHCADFSYDLLKRKPRRIMNMPTIDPDALDE